MLEGLKPSCMPVNTGMGFADFSPLFKLFQLFNQMARLVPVERTSSSDISHQIFMCSATNLAFLLSFLGLSQFSC